MFPSEIKCRRCHKGFGSEALWRLEAAQELTASYRCPHCGDQQAVLLAAAPSSTPAVAAHAPVSQSDVARVQEILRQYRGDLKSLLHRPPQHRKR
jgi:DNA-directed RNA polymerase subunit RPC12/RpoP